MRLLQYLPHLERLGLEFRVSPLLDDGYLRRLYLKQPTDWFGMGFSYARRLWSLLQAAKYDLVWIEKELFPNLPAWPERLLRTLKIPYVVDYDDAIFHNYDLSGHLLKRLLKTKIDTVMRNAALVVCGNAYLAERAGSAGAGRVDIVPTVIDLQRYQPVSSTGKERIVIGWIGSPSTGKYLELVIPALQALTAEFPLQLRIIGTQLQDPRLDVDCRSWSEESEVSEIQEFDIGIMPLLDSPWERGKCGYKLIQYMACGKPVVASPVGVNRDIVASGENGYLASSTQEWILALRRLCQDPAARAKMGARGRLSVEQDYCLQVTAPRMHQLLLGARRQSD